MQLIPGVRRTCSECDEGAEQAAKDVRGPDAVDLADRTLAVCFTPRLGCEIVLCEDSGRRDKARLFVSLTREAIAALRREIADRSIPTKTSWWSYDVIQIDDPDGNAALSCFE